MEGSRGEKQRNGRRGGKKLCFQALGATRDEKAEKTKANPEQTTEIREPRGRNRGHQETREATRLPESNLVNVLYMNARSIFNKRDTLSILLNDKEPDLVLITETWNNPEVSNAMLSIDGYTIEPELRLDRQDTHNGIGGGVMVYVKNGLIVKPNKVDTPYNQMCSFSLKSDDGKDDLNFILYYRSPNCAQANTDYLEEVIKT